MVMTNFTSGDMPNAKPATPVAPQRVAPEKVAPRVFEPVAEVVEAEVEVADEA
jgi:hypothetical protein